MRRRLALILVAACLTGLGLPALASQHTVAAGHHRHRYDVTITRTDYGIPHIVARDFGSLGYGYGYAFAQDNLCTMAADYITVEGQRSRWFGPAKSYTMQGNGVTVSNLDSDFFWTEVHQSHIVQQLMAKAPPLGRSRPSSRRCARVRPRV